MIFKEVIMEDKKNAGKASETDETNVANAPQAVPEPSRGNPEDSGTIQPPAPRSDSRVDVPKPPDAASPYGNAQDASPSNQPTQAYSPNPQYRQSEQDPLRRYRTLVLVSSIAGPVSLFIGGTLLDIVGLVCGIVALVSLNRVAKAQSQAADYAKSLRRAAIVSIVICCVAMALNIATVISIMPELMEMLESGEIQGLGSASTGAATNSTWG